MIKTVKIGQNLQISEIPQKCCAAYHGTTQPAPIVTISLPKLTLNNALNLVGSASIPMQAIHIFPDRGLVFRS